MAVLAWALPLEHVRPFTPPPPPPLPPPPPSCAGEHSDTAGGPGASLSLAQLGQLRVAGGVSGAMPLHYYGHPVSAGSAGDFMQGGGGPSSGWSVSFPRTHAAGPGGPSGTVSGSGTGGGSGGGPRHAGAHAGPGDGAGAAAGGQQQRDSGTPGPPLLHVENVDSERATWSRDNSLPGGPNAVGAADAGGAGWGAGGEGGEGADGSAQQGPSTRPVGSSPPGSLGRGGAGGGGALRGSGSSQRRCVRRGGGRGLFGVAGRNGCTGPFDPPLTLTSTPHPTPRAGPRSPLPR